MKKFIFILAVSIFLSCHVFAVPQTMTIVVPSIVAFDGSPIWGEFDIKLTLLDGNGTEYWDHTYVNVSFKKGLAGVLSVDTSLFPDLSTLSEPTFKFSILSDQSLPDSFIGISTMPFSLVAQKALTLDWKNTQSSVPDHVIEKRMLDKEVLSMLDFQGTAIASSQIGEHLIKDAHIDSISASKIVGELPMKTSLSESKPDGTVSLSLENLSGNTESGASLELSTNKGLDKGAFLAQKDASGKTHVSVGSTTDTDVYIVRDNIPALSIKKDGIDSNLPIHAPEFHGSFSGDGSQLSNISENSLDAELSQKINASLEQQKFMAVADTVYSKDKTYTKTETDSKIEAILQNLPSKETTYTKTETDKKIADLLDIVPTIESVVSKEELAFGGSNNASSSAAKIGVFDEFDHSDGSTLQSVLNDLDSAISTRVSPNDVRLSDPRMPKISGQSNGALMYFEDGLWRSLFGQEGYVVSFKNGRPQATSPETLNSKEDIQALQNQLSQPVPNSRLHSSVSLLGQTIENTEISSVDYAKVTNKPNLGTMASQNSNNVSISGGQLSGMDLVESTHADFNTLNVSELNVKNMTYNDSDQENKVDYGKNIIDLNTGTFIGIPMMASGGFLSKRSNVTITLPFSWAGGILRIWVSKTSSSFQAHGHDWERSFETTWDALINHSEDNVNIINDRPDGFEWESASNINVTGAPMKNVNPKMITIRVRSDHEAAYIKWMVIAPGGDMSVDGL